METKAITKTWEIDPDHSEIHFKVKHMMVSTVTGAFKDFKGKVILTGDNFENAEISFSTKTESINTGNKDRDSHLKSDDFFDATLYPVILFTSTAFVHKGNNEFYLKGCLTIKDVTQLVSLKVNYEGSAIDPYGQKKAGFEITGKISRKEFGLNWSAVTEAGNIVVSDEVRLSLNVQLTEK